MYVTYESFQAIVNTCSYWIVLPILMSIHPIWRNHFKHLHHNPFSFLPWTIWHHLQNLALSPYFEHHFNWKIISAFILSFSVYQPVSNLWEHLSSYPITAECTLQKRPLSKDFKGPNIQRILDHPSRCWLTP